MSSVAEELAKQFALKIVHAKESILIKLLNERLGDTWTIDSLRERCTCAVILNDKEIYYLDGKPLVEFVTPVFSQQTVDQSKLLGAEIGYRVLDDFKPTSEDRRVDKFKRGDLVKKKSGSEWQGTVCGWYSTELTPEGYAVESASHKGSVQIYPASALELVKTEAQAQCAVNGEKHFIQAVTQEKSRGEDYRSFLTCRASDGTRWELRGYGKTVVEATADAWANFKCSEDEWDLHGYPID